MLIYCAFAFYFCTIITAVGLWSHRLSEGLDLAAIDWQLELGPAHRQHSQDAGEQDQLWMAGAKKSVAIEPVGHHLRDAGGGRG